MPDLQDVQLYQRILQRDKNSLEMLYIRYEKLIYSFIYKMTQNPEICEEVIQEVFLKLWRNHSTYSEDKGKFSSWLLTLTRNTALDILRKRKKETPYEYIETEASEAAGESAEDLAEWKERGSLIRRAVSTLKDDQKRVIDLFYFKGLTQSKISEVTDLPLGTVKGRIRLALKHLKDFMDREEEI
ncbi:RNA polymerase sigma factor [Peribacillus kribbensis]|uniref:RNA polymerase sigma factor n=1 Tax=Peribacillus kribbensis TaxID=356658 RepID=UPI0004129610|nr:sigma-70 family RNA polymerase sigma factor [Peribacillus kribbensis]